MSDKPWARLSEIDVQLRTLFPTEMWSNGEVIVTIRMVGGFEMWNSRPYHNYENWSSGYEIETGERYGSIKVAAEDLDDAIELLAVRLKQYRERKEKDGTDSG